MRSTSRITAIAFSPNDPNLLAAVGGDRSIHLWDMITQKERTRLHGALDKLNVLAFSPDGQTIATGGNTDPITLWNAAQTKSDILTVPTEQRNCVLGYSGDGKRLVTLDTTGRIMHRDATSFAVLGNHTPGRFEIGSHGAQRRRHLYCGCDRREQGHEEVRSRNERW